MRTLFENNLDIQPDMLAGGKPTIDLTFLKPEQLYPSTQRYPNPSRYVANLRSKDMSIISELCVKFLFGGYGGSSVIIGKKGYIGLHDMQRYLSSITELYVSNWQMPGWRPHMYDIRLPTWMKLEAKRMFRQFEQE